MRREIVPVMRIECENIIEEVCHGAQPHRMVLLYPPSAGRNFGNEGNLHLATSSTFLEFFLYRKNVHYWPRLGVLFLIVIYK